MTVRRIPAIAGVDVAHGAYCRLVDGKAFPDPEGKGPGGCSAGPASPQGFTPTGEPLQIQTDGGLMASLDGQTGRWVELSGGRIVG